MFLSFCFILINCDLIFYVKIQLKFKNKKKKKDTDKKRTYKLKIVDDW